MLLNEFLKEHRKVQEQDSKIEKQEATIAQLRNEMEAKIAKLEATISEQQKGMEVLAAHAKGQPRRFSGQEVSAQVEISTPERQVVLNNH